MSAANRPHYSIDEYVRLEEYANLRHEYLDGVIWAMAGGTLEHAAMASAVTAALSRQLEGKGCQVYASDARVRVGATGLDTYPDVSVVCGAVARDADDRHAMTNPVVLVEITSDSTEAYDRGEKLLHYKRIDSLRAIVLVSHREPRIEVHCRDDGGWARVEEAGAGAIVRLDSIGCVLAVDEIFRPPFVG